MGMDPYTPEEKARLRRAVARGEAPSCPRCHGATEESAVLPRPDVAYVRKRVWLVCTGCRRSLVVDRPRDL